MHLVQVIGKFLLSVVTLCTSFQYVLWLKEHMFQVLRALLPAICFTCLGHRLFYPKKKIKKK